MTPHFPAVAAAIRKTLESQGFTKLVGAEVVSVEPGVVVMAVNRRPEVLQQNGLFHGGVLAYLIDNATTAAAGTLIDRANAPSSPPNTRSIWSPPRPATASPAAPRWSSPAARSRWSRRKSSAASTARRSWSRSRSRPSPISI